MRAMSWKNSAKEEAKREAEKALLASTAKHFKDTERAEMMAGLEPDVFKDYMLALMHGANEFMHMVQFRCDLFGKEQSIVDLKSIGLTPGEHHFISEHGGACAFVRVRVSSCKIHCATRC